MLRFQSPILRCSCGRNRLAGLAIEGTIAALVKFSGLQPTLATRMCDDLIGTFTPNGAVDGETQKNDLAIIRQVVDGKETIPPARAYDFSFVLDADQQLNKMGWKP
jgi:hypothetical protein